eukprot:1369056-Rhodomonas_salina.2
MPMIGSRVSGSRRYPAPAPWPGRHVTTTGCQHEPESRSGCLGLRHWQGSVRWARARGLEVCPCGNLKLGLGGGTCSDLALKCGIE